MEYEIGRRQTLIVENSTQNQTIISISSNRFDMILFLLVALSIYFKDSPIVSGLLIAPAILFMFAVVIRQANDCRKQHALYNFTMLVSAVNLKMDYASRLVRDLIIYGLHFYLFTLNELNLLQKR